MVEFKNSTSLSDLQSILTYHVVPGKITADMLFNGSVATVQGSNLTISLGAEVMINDATVVQADIETSNGVIHVIDQVLMPPKPDIVDTALAAGNFSTLVDLVATAGLVDTLKSPGPFTVSCCCTWSEIATGMSSFLLSRFRYLLQSTMPSPRAKRWRTSRRTLILPLLLQS